MELHRPDGRVVHRITPEGVSLHVCSAIGLAKPVIRHFVETVFIAVMGKQRLVPLGRRAVVIRRSLVNDFVQSSLPYREDDETFFDLKSLLVGTLGLVMYPFPTRSPGSGMSPAASRSRNKGRAIYASTSVCERPR